MEGGRDEKECSVEENHRWVWREARNYGILKHVWISQFAQLDPGAEEAEKREGRCDRRYDGHKATKIRNLSTRHQLTSYQCKRGVHYHIM